MLEASGEGGVRWMTDLSIRDQKGNMPEDWSEIWMVEIYKSKGDALECNSYRGIQLLEKAMKVIKRVIEARLREKILMICSLILELEKVQPM